jgi:hypothetical protein
VSVTSWTEALDLLEREVDAVEAALAAGDTGLALADVHLPSTLGPLPVELAPRALAIRDRQQVAELNLTRAVNRARQAKALGDHTAPAGPALFDTRG